MIDNKFHIDYCRIDLGKTDYMPLLTARLLTDPDINQMQQIFKDYCDYKQFKSVEPMWNSEFTWDHNDVIGYYSKDKLVAWSLVTKYDEHNVYAVQFAWDYANPRLGLGIKSLKHECAYYKELGYKYYYLGEAHKYKADIDGFEILGPL